MLSFLDGLRDINLLNVVIRLLLAMLCGGAIGIERSYKNRAAGFRTHILICIGATVVSMTGLYLYLNGHLPTDISRIGAQVVSGVGFIGAGTIVVTRKNKITGLTTAAGLWASAIIGLALGGGFYEGAILTTVLILIVQTVIARLETRIPFNPDFRIVLDYRLKPALDQVLRYCKNQKFVIRNLQVTSTSEEGAPYTAVITLRPRKAFDRVAFEAGIRRIEGVLWLRVE